MRDEENLLFDVRTTHDGKEKPMHTYMTTFLSGIAVAGFHDIHNIIFYVNTKKSHVVKYLFPKCRDM